MRRRALISVITAATIAVMACSSVPDITFDDGTTLPGDGGGIIEGGVVDPNCKKTGPEICDDGIDNDCNGGIDCADPACGSFTCVDRGPTDWTLVAYADSTPKCPGAFDKGHDLKVVAGSVDAKCTCTCSAAGSGCSAATFALSFGSDNTCSGGTEMVATKGSCEKVGGAGFDVSANTFVKSVATPAAPTCSPQSANVGAKTVDGRTCALPPKLGGGCPASKVCVPTPGSFAMCLEKAGANVCPTGFPSVRHAGSAAADGRTCTGCTCTATPCGGVAKLYDSVGCANAGTPGLTVTAGGACTLAANANFTARGYVTTATGGCSVGTMAQPNGAVTFTDEETICCK